MTYLKKGWGSIEGTEKEPHRFRTGLRVRPDRQPPPMPISKEYFQK